MLVIFLDYASILLLFGSLRIPHHRQDVRWQRCLMTKVIFTQPSFFCLSEVPADCNDRILIHIPGVTRVLEWAGFPGAFPSSACVIHADPTLHVSWEDVRSTGLRVFEIDYSHVLPISPRRFDNFCLLVIVR